jgi:hypothetical protein
MTLLHWLHWLNAERTNYPYFWEVVENCYKVGQMAGINAWTIL